MRRSVLVTLATLGGLVSLVGGVGLFSALTDTARTSTNSAESAALGGSADIQLANATFIAGGQIECGPSFSENLLSGFFNASSVSPGFTAVVFFCIRNVGSQAVALSAMVDELTDADIACTGDEQASGDTTCGGSLAGELAAALSVTYARYTACQTPTTPFPVTTLTVNATTAQSLGSLAAGATSCFSVDLDYTLSTPAATVQQAQSDRVTWRYKFDAAA